jgi:hypothetical protein
MSNMLTLQFLPILLDKLASWSAARTLTVISPSPCAAGLRRRRISCAVTTMLRSTRQASSCQLSLARHCVERIGYQHPMSVT